MHLKHINYCVVSIPSVLVLFPLLFQQFIINLFLFRHKEQDDTKLHHDGLEELTVMPINKFNPEVVSRKVSGFVGFQTARGQPVEISNDALSKARRLIEDDSELNISNSQPKGYIDKSNISLCRKRSLDMMEGDVNINFCNYKPVGVTYTGVPDSLSKVRKLSDVDAMLNQSDEYSAAFVGFHAANGRQVNVPKEHKAKRGFEDDDTNDIMQEVPSSGSISNCDGFPTARGKPVSVLESSFSKLKKLYRDIESDLVSKHISG